MNQEHKHTHIRTHKHSIDSTRSSFALTSNDPYKSRTRGIPTPQIVWSTHYVTTVASIPCSPCIVAATQPWTHERNLWPRIVCDLVTHFDVRDETNLYSLNALQTWSCAGALRLAPDNCWLPQSKDLKQTAAKTGLVPHFVKHEPINQQLITQYP